MEQHHYCITGSTNFQFCSIHPPEITSNNSLETSFFSWLITATFRRLDPLVNFFEQTSGVHSNKSIFIPK